MKYRNLYRFVFFVACIGLCLSGVAAEGNGTPALRVCEGEDGWLLCAEDLPEEEMALLLLLEVDGEAALDCAAAGMTLTSGERPGGLAVLLDGRPPPADGEGRIPLLRTDRRIRPKEATLYVMGGDGRVETQALRIISDTDDTEAAVETAVETTAETAAEAATETDFRTEPSTAPPPLEMPSEGMDPRPAVYAGCRETADGGGRFDVQFLFCDKENTTPAVICLGGGGEIGMEMGRDTIEGRVWQTVTYRGLASGAEYRFLVFSDEAVVEVVYRRGKYIGQRKTAS